MPKINGPDFIFSIFIIAARISIDQRAGVYEQNSAISDIVFGRKSLVAGEKARRLRQAGRQAGGLEAKVKAR